MTKAKQPVAKDKEQRKVDELTVDLQRTRADFENYRKRVEGEKSAAKDLGKTQTILKLLPIIDTIERATASVPQELSDNVWIQGVEAMAKKVEKLLAEFNVTKIAIVPGKTEFNPEFHEAISMDDEGGDKEIISEELQSGYLMNGHIVRHSMVRVVRK